jgi:outer membrane protein assembly factor BamB
VFAGDLDKHAYAFDAATGRVLWRADLPGAPGGGIVTYLAGDRQRVAFAVGMTNRVMRTTPASAKIAVFGL